MQIETSVSLKDMSISELVALHNRLNPTGAVKSFRDKGTAIKRVEALQSAGAKPGAAKPTAPAKAKADTAEERKKRGYRFVFPQNADFYPPRDGSRRRILFDLLNREKGTTHAEVMEKVGLTDRQAYEAIRLIHYVHGFGLRQDDNGRVYLKVLHPEIPADKQKVKA